MLDVKQQLKSIGVGLLYIICLIFLINYLELSKWEIITLLCYSSFAFQVISNEEDYFNMRVYLSTCIYITTFVHFITWLGAYEVWGYIISIAVICFAILYTRRKRFIEVKRHIESMIWGQPLYKFKEQGKKPPKIEIIR